MPLSATSAGTLHAAHHAWPPFATSPGSPPSTFPTPYRSPPTFILACPPFKIALIHGPNLQPATLRR
ncbi:hypothetical protein FIBSPDRAFT_879164 [Athelia psychrophila]|uniref:Uncharacterized protein n=1 Tax=Athelia psychrophila TaxID=1759441 RepID=A0A167UAU3_9AGAM|nr:hypothetical protein FIBSPDRAFT_879164 [Fibularhizoctonia sp. CBS 109695]